MHRHSVVYCRSGCYIDHLRHYTGRLNIKCKKTKTKPTGSLTRALNVLINSFQRIFVTASRKLNRLEAVTRSPVFAVFTEALAGCETIRAFQAQSAFYEVLDKFIDINRSCYIPLLVACRSVMMSLMNCLVLFYSRNSILWEELCFKQKMNIMLLTQVVGISSCYFCFDSGGLGWSFVRCSTRRFISGYHRSHHSKCSRGKKRNEIGQRF